MTSSRSRAVPVLPALLLVLAAAVFGIVAAAAPAAAATPTCNGSASRPTWIWDPGAGDYVYAGVPAYYGNTSCLLRRGNRGEAVWTLQQTLNRCFGAALVLDGDFGSLTEAALRRAQSRAGTAADGVYGPNTGRAFSNGGFWVAFGTGGRAYCAQLQYF